MRAASDVEDRAGHVLATLGRARAVVSSEGRPGVVLTTPGAVAWLTGGANTPIDRSAAVDVVWVAIGMDRACIITTDVEAPRIAAEHCPERLGLELVAVPWWDADAFVRAAAEAVGSSTESLAADGHPAFGYDISQQLTRERLRLDGWEQDRLRELGRDAAAAVEGALRTWRPGERDRDIAARIAAAVELFGGQAPVLLVGGDDRLRQFRHPVAVGAALHEVVMAVLVASRDGQHVALTRYVAASPPAGQLADGLAAARRLHRRLLAAGQPDVTAGELLSELATGYADEGADGAWSQHYQGGPIGYAQREFEIAPTQTDSPWWSTRLPAGCAVAWNPSLPGGAKDEDTYLIHAGTPELLTFSGQVPGWPLADDQLPARPGVLIAQT